MAGQYEQKRYEFMADDPHVRVLPIMSALIIGAFFMILNETLLNIALVNIMDKFSITINSAQWLATGFMLVMGIVTPASAVLIQWFTTRQLFIGTMLTFAAGTLICASAPVFYILLIGRLIQAVGTGLIIPLIFNVFLLIYPPERRGKVLGLVGLVLMFAPSIGPTLSGIIVEHLGWRYLFIVTIPFILLSILLAGKYLINVSDVTRPKIDILSLVYSSVGFGGTVYGFSAAGHGGNGFIDPNIYIPIIAGMIALLLFTLRQLKLDEPVMDLRTFAFPMFTHAVILVLIINMSMFAVEIILPLYMLGPLALTPAVAGMVLLPGSLISGVLSPVMGSLFDKYGPRPLMIPATFLLSVTMFMMSKFNMDTPLWLVILGYALLMVSVAAIMMPAETNGLNQLPKQFYPHGTAIMSTLQPVAGAIGVAIFISIMTARQNRILSNAASTDPKTIDVAMVGGIELVFFIVFAIALIALVMSLFVYRARPRDGSV